MNNCAICGKPMQLIPAGISKKTGKPYNAFYACEDKTHKQPRVGFSNPAPAPSTQPDWDKIREEKTDNIAWMNAKNNACLLYANGKTEDWKSLAIEIYNFQPPKLKETESGVEYQNEMPPF